MGGSEWNSGSPFRCLCLHHAPLDEGPVQQEQFLLVATFYGKLIDPLVVKDSFLRGSPILSQKVAKIPTLNRKQRQSLKV